MELDLVLRAVVLPAAIAAAIAFAVAMARSRWRRGAPSMPRDPASSGGRVLALLVPVVAALSAATLEGRPWRPFLVPSGTAFEWLPWSIAAGSLVAALVAGGAGRIASLVTCFAASAVAVSLLVPPGLRDGSSQLVVAAVATAAAFGSSRGAIPGVARFASWWLVLSVASAMVLLSGFSKLSFVIASVAALSAALGLLAPMLPSIRAGVATSASLSIALTATAFVGAGYDETGFPFPAWLLLALAPASLAATDIRWFASRPRARVAAAVLLPVTVALVALSVATWATRGNAPTPAEADLYGIAASP